MQLSRFLLTLLATALIACVAASLRAEDGDGGTLFDWGFGGSSDGGPDLDKPLLSDRPKFTQTAVTVGKDVVQLESGYTYTFDDEHGVSFSNHSLPESLLRMGLFADWLEFRLGWDYEIQRTNDHSAVTRDSGPDDLNLGVKLCLTPQDHILPESGVILEMSVPSGGEFFTADEVLPTIDYCYQWDLTGCRCWTISGNTILGGDVDQVTNDSCARFAQSLALDHAWTDNFHSFIEWYMLSPISAVTNHPQYYFDRGMTYYVTSNIQLDLRAGMGLNGHADDFFAGTGLSVRYW
jgi:hypothetical protein